MNLPIDPDYRAVRLARTDAIMSKTTDAAFVAPRATRGVVSPNRSSDGTDGERTA